MAITSASNSVGLVAVVALAWGFTPLFPGFAKADGQVQDMRVEQLETALFDLRVQQCEASVLKKPTISYTEKMLEKQRVYERLRGKPYDLPDCRDLVTASS